MLKQLDKQIASEINSQLDAVAASVSELGPIEALWKQSNSVLQYSFPNVRAAIDAGRRIREKILVLLEKPKCRYDADALKLSTMLTGVPADQRQSVRALITDRERNALSPYVSRADWLSIEEKDSKRLLSGLVIQALILPDHQDVEELSSALAPAHVCCSELGTEPAVVFAEAATFAGPGTAESLRSFGQRKDITLDSYGIKRLQTDVGVRFRQADD